FTLEGGHHGGNLLLVAFEGFDVTNSVTVRARGKDGAQKGAACKPKNKPAGCSNNSIHIRLDAEAGGNGGTVTIYSGIASALPNLAFTSDPGKAGVGCDYQYDSKETNTQKCVDHVVPLPLPPSFGSLQAQTIKVCQPVHSCAVTASENELH